MKPEFRETLLAATDPQVVVDTINDAAAPGAPAPAAAATATAAATGADATAGTARSAADAPAATAATATATAERPLKFVAVTSCPTGIAHTYMAAESLEQRAKSAGYEIAIEPQGSGGFTKLDRP